MSETANSPTRLRAPTIDALDEPIWRLDGLIVALRVVCHAKEEHENDLRNAALAIQYEMEELIAALRRDYELIVPGARDAARAA